MQDNICVKTFKTIIIAIKTFHWQGLGAVGKLQGGAPSSLVSYSCICIKNLHSIEDA